MAVYTVLDRQDIEAFIEPFGIGPLISYEGVPDGIENTNYFLSTDQSDFPSELQTAPIRHFVLTILESIDAQELAFFVELTTLLNLRGLPVPCPLTDANGVAIQTLQNKPAILVDKVAGEHPVQPSEQQCRSIGQTLANVHKACMESGLHHRGKHNLSWVEKLAAEIRPQLDSADQELIEEFTRFRQQVNNHPDLPTAVIHGDLFRDNILFEGESLSGMIDFNSAGDGHLMFDLAVVINDWCSESTGELNPELTHSIIAAYQQVRPFTADERHLWNDFLRIAAVRFWISRLYVQLQPEHSHRPGGLVEQKDPHHYRNILLQRIHSPQQSP